MVSALGLDATLITSLLSLLNRYDDVFIVRLPDYLITYGHTRGSDLPIMPEMPK